MYNPTILFVRKHTDKIMEPVVENMLDCIRRAKQGDPKYYLCHPDYILQIDNAEQGHFPENVKEKIWTHIGFVGSILKNAPHSDKLEIHGLWELNSGAYLGFKFTNDTLPRFMATLSYSKEDVLDTFHPDVYMKYNSETYEYKQPSFSPIYNNPTFLDDTILHPCNVTIIPHDVEEQKSVYHNNGVFEMCDSQPLHISIPSTFQTTPILSSSSQHSPRPPFQEPLMQTPIFTNN